MAAVAKDNLDIIRIPRKAILAELLKKLGGSEAQYESWFQDGKYHAVVRTIIATIEADTSGKLEQVMGCLAGTIEDVEEAAALALIELLKRIYRFEIDDTNFIERVRIERRKEQLEGDIQAAICVHKKQAETISQLSKGWDQLVGDMEFVQEVCEDVCGTALGVLPADYVGGVDTGIVSTMCCLSEWSEQKIFKQAK